MTRYLLGIDLGTSSVKVAVLHADTLQVVANSGAEYPISHPLPEYAEQDPDVWWQATVEAIRQAISVMNQPEIIAIGLSGQMHGLVCINKDMRPVQDAIIWADRRSEQQVRELAQLQKKSTNDLPGLPATGFAASTALWLKTNAPEILKQTHKWCLPKDYLRLKLTGELSTEPSDAASTWLYDITQQSWAEDVCEYCGLLPSQMPLVDRSDNVSGALTRQSAIELGLPSGIPVVGGSADLPAQALGYGINSPDSLLITIGSGGQVFIPTSKPKIVPDAPYYIFNHNVPETWYFQTSILSAGLSLRWFRDLIGMTSEENAYEYLSNLAENTSEGADGLLFLPYLAGERGPNLSASMQGLIYGLRLTHQREHLSRAIMEGVGFAIKNALLDIPIDASIYVLSGGVTNSPVWCQILTDILDHVLEVPVQRLMYGCIGAGILAGVGCEHFTGVSDGIQLVQARKRTAFTPMRAERYHEIYQQFQELYLGLRTAKYAMKSP